ncbi:MAG: uracil-DNA glycosylase [Acidobacteria bacterium]|nr:uracil-DNA glycosylase [Acidobacteriota bacterium]
MSPETEIAEFVSLLKETREQLSYFKELGVEGLERSTASQPVPAKVTHADPALHEASRNTDTGISPGPPASENIRRPAAREEVFSPQVDALFGDLAAPPVRIQKSSESFEEIWADIGDCTRCPLYQERTNIVHTDGNRRARLMFVGEAPGADEDAQARPFVGRAGQLLTKIIEAIGLKREEVLIGNVNRCRPPGNRPPTPEEVSMCKPFLLREIAAVQPEVIVVLGNTAMRNLLDIKQGITRVRGQFQDYQGVKVMPTFHPAYLLRDPSKKKETWEDLKKVRDYLDTTRKRAN